MSILTVDEDKFWRYLNTVGTVLKLQDVWKAIIYINGKHWIFVLSPIVRISVLKIHSCRKIRYITFPKSLKNIFANKCVFCYVRLHLIIKYFASKNMEPAYRCFPISSAHIFVLRIMLIYINLQTNVLLYVT